MTDIKRRLEKVEKRLRVTDEEEPLVVLHCYGKDKTFKQLLPEPLQDWLTYKQQYEKNEPYNGLRIIHLCPEDELKARKLQKETEGNKKAKNE